MKRTFFSVASLAAAFAAALALPAYTADTDSNQIYLTDDDIHSAVEEGLSRSAAFNPMMRLLGSGSDADHGGQIAFNDDDAASGMDDARIDITLPAAGTYFVHATVYGGGTGPYTFELTRH